jgi:glucose/arabinose dehydrogenase
MFGPRGHLFAATGDGGTGGANSQDRSNLLGKLLRIDPHRRGYSVPDGNPFVGRRGRNEIFSMGLRNPFRFTFYRRRIAIGDVGQDSFEEVDYETMRSASRANFGWPRYEGFHHLFGPRPAHYEPPIFAYAHTAANCESLGGCAITGGLVVHRAGLPSLAGLYLYSDFFKGQLRSLVPGLRRARRDRRLGVHVERPVDFARAPHGRIYVVSLAGPVYRLVHR